MAKQHKDSFELLSNEWAIPYWLLGIFALLLGMLSYLVQLLAPDFIGIFNNVMFLLLIVLLSLFYKKLYITRVEITVTTEGIELRYLKFFFPETKFMAFSEITAYGAERTEAIEGLLKVPEKHWLLLQRGKKRTYFYQQSGQESVKALFHILKKACSEAEQVENILK